MSRLTKAIKKFVKPTDHILALGIGIGIVERKLVCDKLVGVDAYQPYLDQVKGFCEPILWDLNNIPLPFEDESFDVVLSLDVIEHLEKEAGENLLNEIERIAKRTVIVFTPDGFLKQDNDGWGLGGDYWQKHRSGWSRQYFIERGYNTKMYPGDMAHDKPYKATLAWKFMMADKFKVSVVIPNYNHGNYIGSAISSVINQTKAVHEIIVVDDCSMKYGKELIEALEEHRNKGIPIYHIQHVENEGIGATLNSGIRNMSGDVFCWLSADDYWEPTKIEEQILIASANPNSILYTKYKTMYKDGTISAGSGVKVWTGNFGVAVLRGCFINFSTCWIPKSVLDNVGWFNSNFRFYEDYEWLIRAALIKKQHFILVDKPLVVRRINDEQATVINKGTDLAAKYSAEIRNLKRFQQTSVMTK